MLQPPGVQIILGRQLSEERERGGVFQPRAVSS